MMPMSVAQPGAVTKALCDQELIHIPGAIQPHGALLAVRMDEWLITHASANLGLILGRSADSVLGQPLSEAIGEAAALALRSIGPSNGVGPIAVHQTVVGTDGGALHLHAHRIGRQVCIDIEPVDRESRRTSPLMLTQPVLDSFKHATSSAELCELAVRGMRDLTGYDRVIVYSFNEAGGGDVIAESGNTQFPSCLGLQFPASDIPPQARLQYLRQRVGMVADSHYVPVGLIAGKLLDDQAPLDLTYSCLRSVSPMHRQYMRNMGTAASLSVGLVDGDALWGMMVCHHATPRVSGTEVRAAVNVIGQVVSLLHGSLRQADLSTQRLRRNTMLRTLVDRLASALTLPAALASVEAELLHLVDATGAVVRISGEMLYFGRTLTKAQTLKALSLLHCDSCGDVLAVDDLGRRYPDLAGDVSDGCGALLLPLSYCSDDAILWFRPEQRRTIQWGGDPAASGPVDPSSGYRTPRSSFAAWPEEVKHHSAPWTQADIALAAEVARRVEAELVRRTKAELAQAQNASRAKSRFLAGMSHELRTPLHGILGYAKLLDSEGNLNDLQSMRVRAMMGASTHLLEMINRVLEFSEIEAEQVRLCSADLDVCEVVTTCLDVLRPAAQAKGLSLNLTAEPGVNCRIRADSMRLRQILLNLLANAVKFTAVGGVEVFIRAADHADALRIEVIDTGPGIPMALRSRLFQDFERLDHTSGPVVEGAGLGLALSRRLLALMGGCIGYEPRAVGGSIFRFDLPYGDALARGSKTAPGASGQRAAAVRTPSYRVLLADDSAVNRDIAENFLQTAGHVVTSVPGGRDAIDLAERQDFDVILMDVRMPDIDGLDATRRIRALGGRRSRVPILALTAQAFSDQVEECLHAGMDGHLAKPFSPEMLNEAVLKAAALNTLDRDRPAVTRVDEAPGMDLQLSDERVFNKTASYLSKEALAAHLRTLTSMCANFLAGLNTETAAFIEPEGLTDLAHKLAGSAGMFGYSRLAGLCSQFERRENLAATDQDRLTQALRAAVEQSLPELKARQSGSGAPL